MNANLVQRNENLARKHLPQRRGNEKIATKDLAIPNAKVLEKKMRERQQPFTPSTNASVPTAYNEVRIRIIRTTSASSRIEYRVNATLTLVKLLQKGPNKPIKKHQAEVVHQSYHKNLPNMVQKHHPQHLQTHVRVTSATLLDI